MRRLGEVQIEVLQSMIKERFGVEVTLARQTVYKETIANTVEGVGHLSLCASWRRSLFAGLYSLSGLQFGTICSEDIGEKLAKACFVPFERKNHKGVLTGQLPIGKLRVGSRKAHKHTDGGDFREATYRAVRQGLKEAQSVLLGLLFFIIEPGKW